MKEWFTLEGLAGYLKISCATLYKMAQRGEIPAFKLGRCWRFDRDAVDRWLQKRDPSHQSPEFPWQDCLDSFIEGLRTEFGNRFASVWIYGSWVRGEAQPESDIDLLVVMNPLHPADSRKISTLAYQSTFERNRPVVFSTQVVDQQTFLTGLEPLLLNIRKEGRQAA